MGKALLFKGITVSDPVATVTFDSDLPPELFAYFNTLNTTLTDAQKQAFITFRETLVNADLWNSIVAFYPMFGSLDDAAIGIKGDNLLFGENASYNKGIKLANAVVASPWASTNVTGEHTFYVGNAFNIGKSTSCQPHYYLFSDANTSRNIAYLSSGIIYGVGVNGETVHNTSGNVIANTVDGINYLYKIYRNGVLSDTKSGGTGATINGVTNLIIGGDDDPKYSHYSNMYIWYNELHTAEQVALISRAIMVLERDLFGADITIPD